MSTHNTFSTTEYLTDLISGRVYSPKMLNKTQNLAATMTNVVFIFTCMCLVGFIVSQII